MDNGATKCEHVNTQAHVCLCSFYHCLEVSLFILSGYDMAIGKRDCLYAFGCCVNHIGLYQHLELMLVHINETDRLEMLVSSARDNFHMFLSSTTGTCCYLVANRVIG